MLAPTIPTTQLAALKGIVEIEDAIQNLERLVPVLEARINLHTGNGQAETARSFMNARTEAQQALRTLQANLELAELTEALA